MHFASRFGIRRCFQPDHRAEARSIVPFAVTAGGVGVERHHNAVGCAILGAEFVDLLPTPIKSGVDLGLIAQLAGR